MISLGILKQNFSIITICDSFLFCLFSHCHRYRLSSGVFSIGISNFESLVLKIIYDRNAYLTTNFEVVSTHLWICIDKYFVDLPLIHFLGASIEITITGHQF